MELTFWGVRGSIPSPSKDTLTVGGNTSCVSVRYGDFLCVFDAGTGIRLLGNYLEEDEHLEWRGALFFTHYHWDHIQGLPFFLPARRKKNRFQLYGEKKAEANLVEILRHQMQSPFFPVDLDIQEGLVSFTPIAPGSVVRPHPGLTVHTERLNHPNGAIGYRLESSTSSVCLVTDHEHPADALDERVVAFARGADVLIHEAQYHPSEKRGPKAGWGHSSWEEAALTAKEAGVGKLYLTHHDPDRTDREVFDILVDARRTFPRTELAIEGDRCLLP